MPNTTSFDFADVVLVPFPFTDQTTTKKRPAVIVSSAEYHEQRRDLILMAITSHFRPVTTVGEVIVQHWQQAGLIKPSVLKPLLATVEKSLVLRAMGKLQEDDRAALRKSLDEILGQP
jgi:mRNA interferase MazF